MSRYSEMGWSFNLVCYVHRFRDFCIWGSGAAIIGGTGGHVPQHFGWGDAKVSVPPLIAHLVTFLGHIFHLDKLHYCISGVPMHCSLAHSKMFT